LQILISNIEIAPKEYGAVVQNAERLPERLKINCQILHFWIVVG